MYRFTLLIFLFVSIYFSAPAQTDADTLLIKIQRQKDSLREINRIDDSIRNKAYLDEQAKRNVENIVRLQQDIKKRNDKEKRNAMIRIGIGVLFMAVLVIGLMRRRKTRKV